MTTPPPIKISAEAVDAYSAAVRDACNAAHSAGADQPAVREGIHAGLEAVAPLIAAQVLPARSALEIIARDWVGVSRPEDVHPDERISITWQGLVDLLADPGQQRERSEPT